MKRRAWQKLRIIGWLLLSIPLTFRMLKEVYINGFTYAMAGYFSALVGTILVAVGYWFGEMKSKSIK